MNPHTSLPVGCACCPMSRRSFLKTGCACAGAAGAALFAGNTLAAERTGKLRLKVVYSLHAPVQPGPDWPNVGFDFRPVMEKFTNAFAQAFPDMEFETAMAANEDEAKAILKADTDAGKKGPDGYIVYQLNCWNRIVQTLATSDKPVLYADFQYGGSGGFLVYTAAFLRENRPNVGFVASSKIEDHIAAVRCFPGALSGKGGTFAEATARVRREHTARPAAGAVRADDVKTVSAAECVEKMKASRILAFLDQNTKPEAPYGIVPVVYLPFAELNEAWEKADRDASAAVAERWVKNAAVVEGVDPAAIQSAAAMYVGMKEILKRHDANAVTINCLGGFYGGHIHAYPCLGFHELCNEGLVGACECDVRSTSTMVALSALTNGRTGFISDPVVDTARNAIIYAHCVAPNRAFGPGGPANPYQILTHSEDRQGASVRSVLPTGCMTTTIELGPDRKEILFHQGVAVDNDPDDRACRTKLVVEPKGDIEKLFTMWDTYGWHRVTAYGDLREPVFALADALGYTVHEEA